MKFTRSVFIIIAALGFTAYLPAQEKVLPTTIVVGVLKGPTGIGLIRLVDKPLVLPDGRKVECAVVPSVDLMVAKLARKELVFASLPTNTAASLYKLDTGYALAAVTGNGMLSVLTRDPSIKGVADLRGKTLYASGQGAVPEYVLRAILTKASIDPDTGLSLRFGLAYPEIAASLIAGKIDTALLPEPFATMALSGSKELRQAFDVQKEYAGAGGAADYPISVLSVRSDFARAEPAAAVAILQAVKESIAWVKANPAEAGALAEKLDFGLKAAVATASIPKTNYVFRTAKESKSDIQALFSLFLARDPDSLGGALPDEGFYAF